MKEKITIATKKDFEITWFSGGPGAGGQYRNKHNNCCRIKHIESGAMSQATDQRSQEANKKTAFKRIVETPKFKFWLAKKLYEIQNNETVEQYVERQMAPENLIIEVMDDGKWVPCKD